MARGCYVKNDLLGCRRKTKVIEINVDMMNHVKHWSHVTRASRHLISPVTALYDQQVVKVNK